MVAVYIAAIENCYSSITVNHILFPAHIVSLLLGASFNMVFATCITSLLLGASFNMKYIVVRELHT